MNGHHDVCQYLIYRGAKVNYLGGELCANPLHWAIRQDVLDIVQLLLYHRADPNIQDAQGYSAVHIAVQASSSSVLSALLQEVVEVDARELFGHTPLMWAAYQGNPQFVGLLLKHGAKVNLQDELGFTPLHWAIANENRLSIRILMSCGADVHAKDKEGKTSQDMAAGLVSLLTLKTTDGWDFTDEGINAGQGPSSPFLKQSPQKSQPRAMIRGMSTSTVDVDDAPPSYDDPVGECVFSPLLLTHLPLERD